jgi:hypothetical protein
MATISELGQAMSRACGDILEGLTAEQRKKMSLPFGDEAERRRWYYTPTPREGLPLLDMNARQQQRVRELLAIALSEPGYNHTAVVMGLESIVDRWQGFPDRTYGDLPGTRLRDPLNYCFAIFGTPGDPDGWSWRIGGHHVCLHFTVRQDKISPTPAFYGAEPARVMLPGGAMLRPLSAEEDLARQLLGSLNEDQLAKAVISPVAATDIVQTNRPRIEEGALYQIGGGGPGGQALRDELGLTPEMDEILRYSSSPKGLAATAMDAAQREVLTQLIHTYFEHVADPIAGQFTSLLRPEAMAGIAFAWAGSSEFAAPHYYRVQGERLLIEYDCTQNDANHTHSVWRDPLGDFGEDILARHYALEHR